MRRISADYIFVPDKATRRMSPLRHGCVAIDEKGKIVEITELSEDIAEGVEFYKGIIVPGFVNAHCHIELSHLKGAFKEATGMSGFINQINALRESVDREERVKAMSTEFVGFQSQGIVGCADISNCDESFELKRQYALSPMRVLFRTFVELFGTEPKEAEEILQQGIALAKKAGDLGIDAAVTPHSCYTMSPRLIELTVAEGLKSGYLSYHNQESAEEEELIMSGTGPLAENYKGRNLSTPPVAGTTALEYFIERVRRGSAVREGKIPGRINLVHNVVISERSIDAATEAFEEPFFTICPLSNIFIHRALPPIDLMRKKGLTLCLGTDSLSSNKTLSIAEEIKCIGSAFPYIPLGEILTWASLNGAKAIGRERELGSIAVGKSPGIILITDTLPDKNFALSTWSRTLRIA